MSTRTIDHRYSNHTTWTNIARPDDTHKTLIRQDGSLLYAWQNALSERAKLNFRRIFEFSLYGMEPVKTVQYSDEAHNNIVITRQEYPHCILTMTAFGHEHEGKRTDVMLWEIRALPAAYPFGAALQMHLLSFDEEFVKGSPADGKHTYAIFPTSTDPEKAASPYPALITSPHPIMQGQYHFCPPRTMVKRVFITQQDYHQELAAGGVLEGAVILPQDHGAVEGLDFAWARQALERERRYWNELVLVKNALRVPDQSVQQMLEACVRNIFQAREIKDGTTYFQVGATLYRGLWVVDGYFILEAVRYLGHEEAARQGIDALLKQVKPDGMIMIIEGHSKETAIALATFVRQCELSNNWDWLRELWPVVRNAVKAIQAQRAEAYALPKDHVCHGLWPESIPDGGLGEKRPEYTSALWTLAGLKKIAHGARMIGEKGDADVFQAEYESLLKDFNAHAKRNMEKTAGGIDHLPIRIPGGSSDSIFCPKVEGDVLFYHRVLPGNATWALCQAIYPGEVFPPEDFLVQSLLELNDSLDDEEGIPKETGYLAASSVWSYHASFAAHVWAYADRWDKMVDYLYEFANHAAPTRVWCEEQSLRGVPYLRWAGDMPHNWSSAEFIRMVRHILVFEREQALELLPGLPESWLKPNDPVIVEKTPTRFGRVSVRLDMEIGGRIRIRYERETPDQNVPAAVVRLRIPGGRSALVDGRPAKVDERGWLLLDAATASAEVLC